MVRVRIKIKQQGGLSNCRSDPGHSENRSGCYKLNYFFATERKIGL